MPVDEGYDPQVYGQNAGPLNVRLPCSCSLAIRVLDVQTGGTRSFRSRLIKLSRAQFGGRGRYVSSLGDSPVSVYP